MLKPNPNLKEQNVREKILELFLKFSSPFLHKKSIIVGMEIS